MILVTMIHARNHADSQHSSMLGQCRRRRGESLSGQGISNHRDLVGSESGPDQAIGSGLRIADHDIAPAKRTRLRAKLRRSHQVSNLPMAADYNRDSSQFRGGNQCEIGVEIEGMGDLHSMLTEITTKVEPRAQRAPSEEAASERKLLGVRKVMG